MASIDQSLKRLGLEYIDIFYHHRMDPETPLEETMEALAQIFYFRPDNRKGRCKKILQGGRYGYYCLQPACTGTPDR